MKDKKLSNLCNYSYITYDYGCIVLYCIVLYGFILRWLLVRVCLTSPVSTRLYELCMREKDFLCKNG